MKKKLFEFIFLPVLFAILVYIGIMECGLFIWIALVPGLYLVFKYNFGKIWQSALLGSILIPIFLTWFVVIFDNWYFLYAILYIGSFYWLFLLTVNLIVHKITWSSKVLAPPFVWLLFTFIYSLMPGKVQW